MAVELVSGDPLQTTCQTLAIGHNRTGRTEMDDFSRDLMRKFPAAYASYEQRCRKNRQASGELYLWTQSKPRLLFLTVRDSSVGATRLRHVQQCLITVARDYRQYQIESLAIAPLSIPQEWEEIRALIERWLSKMPVQVEIYR